MKKIYEDAPSIGAIPGAGNPAVPSGDALGSGDTFNFSPNTISHKWSSEKKKKKSNKYQNFRDFLKSIEEIQAK